VCEPHINKNKLIPLFGDALRAMTEGVEQADLVVYLVAHKRFKTIDQKILNTKIVLDFCGITHEPRQSNAQEQLLWPTSKIDNNQSLEGAHLAARLHIGKEFSG
jgi:UDP-N-acetyl-D-mannosaminuronate dehydrogenase